MFPPDTTAKADGMSTPRRLLARLRDLMARGVVTLGHDWRVAFLVNIRFDAHDGFGSLIAAFQNITRLAQAHLTF